MAVTVSLLLPATPTGDLYVDEGSSIPIQLSRDTTGNDVVRIAPSQYGSAGVFPTGAGETVAFAPGEASRVINLTTLDDTTYEDFERFALDVTPIGGTVLNTGFLFGAVRNNDSLPTIGLTTTTPQVLESAAGAKFHFDVTRAGSDLSMETRVEVRLAPEGTTPADANDFSGANASLGSVFVVFKPGETTKPIEVDIRNDSDIEAAETIRASVTWAASTSPESRFSSDIATPINYAGNTVTATILNDDPNSGTPGAEKISTYSYDAQVVRLYDTMLDRFPEIGGRVYYVNQLNNGEATIRSLETNFQNSPEFTSKYGNTSDDQFITLLYQNTLNRAPEAGAVEYYLNRIQAGETRGVIVENFSEAPEHIALVDRTYPIDFV